MFYFRFEKNNLFLPWIGLTILAPANFVGNLVLNLIFFNFPGAWWLIMKEGIPTLLITYLVTVVYTLYLHMSKTSPDEETPAQGSDTLYGTDNVVFVTEASSSVVGTALTRDSPPSYDSLVQAHKDHVRT